MTKSAILMLSLITVYLAAPYTLSNSANIAFPEFPQIVTFINKQPSDIGSNSTNSSSAGASINQNLNSWSVKVDDINQRLISWSVKIGSEAGQDFFELKFIVKGRRIPNGPQFFFLKNISIYSTQVKFALLINGEKKISHIIGNSRSQYQFKDITIRIDP
jgi:hypothetical protein